MVAILWGGFTFLMAYFSVNSTSGRVSRQEHGIEKVHPAFE